MAARTATGDVAIADRKSKLIEAEDGKNPVQSPSQTLCLRASVRSPRQLEKQCRADCFLASHGGTKGSEKKPGMEVVVIV